MKKHLICHLTSAHSRYDTRIFLKECHSLKKNSYDVIFIVADGLGDEIINGIQILDVGLSKPGKIQRMISTTRRVYLKAKSLKADLYHFHDPEMMPYMLILKLSGRKVVMDIHEFFPKQVITKDYIPKFIRPALSMIVAKIEKLTAKQMSGVIVALPNLKIQFKQVNENTALVQNYPILSELKTDGNALPYSKRERAVAFVGGITKIRGLDYLVKSLEISKVKLYLAGNCASEPYYNYLKSLPGWKFVVELGQISREDVSVLLNRVMAGYVTYLPAPNHIEAQPTKMFEYMSASLPVICSNFPLWRSIVDDKCGIAVDPVNIDDIALATKSITENESLWNKFSAVGQNLIENKYNWEHEEKALLDSYKNILS
ncbi:glycosyltransferase [Marivirga arenosa]|uniref:Glycosyltransferase n=1 Tax=Marivirga arenosa TaxID=3059076 RepID=A0AA51ZVX3_9BACT|nr:glycosyltransferase [Marivirga sp. BKB1-2]WNB17745.1 glycosyltransferase [Marivirga sp. BKB1-2]